MVPRQNVQPLTLFLRGVLNRRGELSDLDVHGPLHDDRPHRLARPARRQQHARQDDN